MATPIPALFDMTGRVALVTGGSRGLGLEIAGALGDFGAKVIVTARRERWLTEAREELQSRGIECLAMVCDVTSAADVHATVAAGVEAFGTIDVLVNSAGISWGAPADAMPLDKWREVIDTNVTGSFLMAQAVGREMIAAGRGGSIVNIASVAGVIGLPADVLDAVGYSASKGALIGLTRDLAAKWAPHGIRVNAIAPGFFDTRLTEKLLEHNRTRIEQRTPMGRVGAAGEIGGVALFLAGPAASYITGQVLAVDGGMTAW